MSSTSASTSASSSNPLASSALAVVKDGKVRKKVDSRIRTLIENAVANHHRGFFVIVGDKGRDQIVNLHYMLSKATVKARPSVLWCYKKDLGFSSSQKKRIKLAKKLSRKKAVYDPEKEGIFETFISSTNIRYTYYHETHKILGNTFGMCVLQDFEAITPNLLARTIETVEGGGLVVLLLKTMKSLKQLYTMAMDVHSRFRTESHQEVTARFNERFLLSLGSCKSCLVLDDELNLLSISSHCRSITPVEITEGSLREGERELQELVKSVTDVPTVGPLVSLAKTVDQAQAILKFIDAISEKTLRSTVTLTASRGRGKSAALGIAIAAALSFEYSNIFVTSPSPENLKTAFEFVFKAFDKLGYKEHLDYELVESTNPEFNKAIIRVNVFRTHRQTIQYIQPQDYQKLGQAELVVIDEAAAIPLPYVKRLLGPYLVFMASTINGYEGTGRSLSLKLIQQLRQQSLGSSAASNQAVQTSSGGRVLREISLDEPIRYARKDPIEQWLNQLLCLDATVVPMHIAGSGCPHPSTCNLYYVNKDTLFSYHKDTEIFLQRMMALYVSSHYKNTPNDLQMISDAPSHHLFVLLAPVNEKKNQLPEILCVIQVSLEGGISKDTVIANLSQGEHTSGDLIPWTISQQFQDHEFATLSGARVVRIATHPDYQKMGYGTRALALLEDYYKGLLTNLDEIEQPKNFDQKNEEKEEGLLIEKIQARDIKKLPPLLNPLSNRAPESLDYLGVAYGMTPELFKFWKRAGYSPVYIRQTPNEITGEYSCIMLKNLPSSSIAADWLSLFTTDFKHRFSNLLNYSFSSLTASLALSILDPKQRPENEEIDFSAEDLTRYFTLYDLKRLDSYSRNLVDYYVITDLIPLISQLYFKGKLPNISPLQAVILVGYGLQHKSMDTLTEELGLPINQVLAMFNKAIRKINQFFKTIQEKEISKTLPTPKEIQLNPLPESLDSELNQGAKKVKENIKEKQENLLKSLNATQFVVGGKPDDWEQALKGIESDNPSSISIARNPLLKRKQNNQPSKGKKHKK